MTNVPIPSNENERIEVLNELNILYTPSEERFDRVTRLTKYTFNVPIALVSFVHTNIQWFKSVQGLCVTETSKEVSFCAYAILKNDVFIVEDALKDERFKNNALVTGEPFIRFYAGYPLMIDDFKLGTLCIIDTIPRTFDAKQQEALRDFSLLIVNELKVIKLKTAEEGLVSELEVSKRMALLDPLTGCWNKKAFDRIFDNELAKLKRNNDSLSLAMIDIDYFKKINDSYGHLTGDFILKEVAQRLRLSLRGGDHVIRYGGEEFMVIMPSTNAEGAIKTSNRILKNMYPDFITDNDKTIKLTTSIGVVSFNPAEALNKEDMIEKVDKFLYKAKNNGRNQVVSN